MSGWPAAPATIRGMLDLPATLDCPRCGLQVETLGWHDCPRRVSDSWERFEAGLVNYPQTSAEAAFTRYLIARRLL